MNQVCIPIPMPPDGETLELEVTVGGTMHLMQYRIETLWWGPDVSPDLVGLVGVGLLLAVPLGGLVCTAGSSSLPTRRRFPLQPWWG